MSDVQKPVEETPAAVPTTETPAEAPAAAEAATEAPATEETPAAATEEAAKPAEETKPAEAKEEVKPASEGVLGHKGPGLIKSLRFAKRFFYFNDEATESKNLSVFHQNEKPATANPTAAWATQTGKGLFFQTKRAEDKATPAGIFNLADVSDLTKEGSNEFIFKVAGQKHTFQAANTAERDSWFVALEAKAAEAKAEKETITSSEGYKAELEKLTKPAAAVAGPATAAAAAAATTADKAEEPKKEGEEAAKPAEETEAKAEEPKKEEAPVKSRSKSRQRFSIFGKKDVEKKEEKKEETPAAAAATTEEAKAAEGEEPAAETAAEPAAATEEAAKPAEEEAKPAEEETKEETKKEETKKKRSSVFGSLFQKVTSPSQEKSEKEATAPAEDTAVATSAPQLENPVEEADVKPIEPESVTAPAEGEAAKEPAAETPAEATSPKDKRRTSFFGFGKKEKKADSDNEATDSEAKDGKKGNKLGGLFRKPTNAKKVAAEAKEETKEEADKKEEITETPAAEAAATEETPAVAAATEEAKPAEGAATEEAKNVEVPASTPVQAAA